MKGGGQSKLVSFVYDRRALGEEPFIIEVMIRRSPYPAP